MRDGDNADQLNGRTPRSSLGAAPVDGDASGNHTAGVPVADLIARMGDVAGRHTTRRRLTNEPTDPRDDPAWQNVVTARIPGLRRSPIPHFTTARRPGRGRRCAPPSG